MNFNFENIERAKSVEMNLFPEDRVRVGKGHITIGTGGMKYLKEFKDKTPEGRDKAWVGVAYDHTSQALKLYSRADGFTALVSEGGIGTMTIPKNLLRKGIVHGDYVLVDGERTVYKLAKGLTDGA